MIKYFFIRTIYNESNPFHTVVLTAAQTTAFFEKENQMGISHATVVQLAKKGITSVIDQHLLLRATSHTLLSMVLWKLS
jgi:hypothetical protein